MPDDVSSLKPIVSRKYEKALDMAKNGTYLEEKTLSGLLFKVAGDSRKHTVIFDYLKGPEGTWSCDCEYSSIHPNIFCSHILAAKIFLSGDKELKKEV